MAITGNIAASAQGSSVGVSGTLIVEAPALVRFDCKGTTSTVVGSDEDELFMEVTHRVNFGDTGSSGSGHWDYPAYDSSGSAFPTSKKQKNESVFHGQTAHWYEEPGVYTVTHKAHDTSSESAVVTLTIQVKDTRTVKTILHSYGSWASFISAQGEFASDTIYELEAGNDYSSWGTLELVGDDTIDDFYLENVVLRSDTPGTRVVMGDLQIARTGGLADTREYVDHWAQYIDIVDIEADEVSALECSQYITFKNVLANNAFGTYNSFNYDNPVRTTSDSLRNWQYAHSLALIECVNIGSGVGQGLDFSGLNGVFIGNDLQLGTATEATVRINSCYNFIFTNNSVEGSDDIIRSALRVQPAYRGMDLWDEDSVAEASNPRSRFSAIEWNQFNPNNVTTNANLDVSAQNDGTLGPATWSSEWAGSCAVFNNDFRYAAANSDVQTATDAAAVGTNNYRSGSGGSPVVNTAHLGGNGNHGLPVGTGIADTGDVSIISGGSYPALSDGQYVMVGAEFTGVDKTQTATFLVTIASNQVTSIDEVLRQGLSYEIGDSISIDVYNSSGNTAATLEVDGLNASVSESHDYSAAMTEPTAFSAAATAITLSSYEIAVSAPGTWFVGSLSNNDPDVGDTHTYSMAPNASTNDNDKFSVSQLGNWLLWCQPSVIGQGTYDVDITVNDGKGGVYTEFGIEITVTPPNLAPTDIALNNYSVSQSLGVDAAVGGLIGTDSDSTLLSFVLPAGVDDNDLFKAWELLNNFWVLTANDASAMAVGIYQVHIECWDDSGNMYDETIDITVTV